MKRPRLNKQLASSRYRWARTLIFILGLFIYGSSVYAQNISYYDLLQKENQPNIYVDHLLLPSFDTTKVEFVTMFRVDYKLLRFKKFETAQSNIQSGRRTPSFEAKTTLSLELFAGDEKTNPKQLKNSNYQTLEPVTRKFWEHTVYAETYEQTKSNRHYLSGFFKTKVDPGMYRYLMQITQSNTKESIKRSRTIRIRNTGKDGRLPFYYVDSLDSNQRPRKASIINFGNNVNYGKDFYLLFQLPSNRSDYEISISEITVNEKDTLKKETVFSADITEKQTITNARLGLNRDSTEVSLVFNYDIENGNSYGLIHIPNSRFENGKYRTSLKDKKSGNILSRDFYQSHWINMPVSLLNIDVSIRMLRYIISEDKINEMLEGNRQQRIKKFREFWDSKDPTPNTAYNELMAEYYQRIDRAYEKFSSINKPGYETDMGKIFIRRGPPDKVERRFPSGQRAVEIWSYPQKTYVFRATSGFGDFELVSEK